MSDDPNLDGYIQHYEDTKAEMFSKGFQAGIEAAARFMQTHEFIEVTYSGDKSPTLFGFKVLEVAVSPAKNNPRRAAMVAALRALADESNQISPPFDKQP